MARTWERLKGVGLAGEAGGGGKETGWMGARLGWGPEESEKAGELREALYLL